MRLPDTQMIPIVLSHQEAEAQLDVISQLFYRTADGVATIADIGEICGLEPHLAQRIAAMLAGKGLFDIPGFVPIASGSATSSIPPRPSLEPSDPALVELVDHYRTLLATTNFYELLEVDTDASRSEIRNKYFELSKQLHPDRAFGRDIGDIRRHMEAVFHRITEAYETLSHPAKRGEYDARHGIQPRPSRPASSRVSSSAPPVQPRASAGPSSGPAAQASTNPARRNSTAPTPRSSAIPPSSPSGQRLTSVPPRATDPSRTSAPPRPSAPAPDELHRRLLRERTGRALAAALGRPSMAPRPSRAPNTSIEEAKLALDREHYEDAIRFLTPLLTADPDDAQCLELIATAKAGLSRVRARNLISRSLVERRRGNYETAEELLNRAIEVDRSNLDAKHLIAEMLVERQLNIPRALTLAREVIAAGGQRARYYTTLGDIFALNNEQSRANEAYRRALALDPENKELLKKLERSDR